MTTTRLPSLTRRRRRCHVVLFVWFLLGSATEALLTAKKNTRLMVGFGGSNDRTGCHDDVLLSLTKSRRLGCPCQHRHPGRTAVLYHSWSGSTSGAAAPSASSPPHDTSSDDGRRIVIPVEKSAESTFWHTVPQRAAPDDEDSIIPVFANLDADGPLPPKAYRVFDRADDDDVRGEEVKRTCLVTVAIDPPFDVVDDDGTRSGIDPTPVGVRNMQRCIDHGFTTFQIATPRSSTSSMGSVHGGAPATTSNRRTKDHMLAERRWKAKRNAAREMRRRSEACLYGQLTGQTPPSVLRTCNLMHVLDVPSCPEDGEDGGGVSAPFGDGWMVRESICGSLLRAGLDCLDTVQVEYCADSPYHLDVLNVLSDLRREGLVRTVSALNFPPSLLRSSADCGFVFGVNQMRCNLLDPSALFLGNMDAVCDDLGTKIMTSSPLAGGLLTNRYASMQPSNRGVPPPLLFRGVTPPEQEQLRATLNSWATGHSEGGDRSSVWQTFDRLVLRTVSDIAVKHQVSIASVALRWSMQLDNLGSVVVGTNLGMNGEEDAGGPPYRRFRDWREVFTFELDGDDLERLWDVAGRQAPRNPARFDDADFLMGDYDFDEPDLSNRKLWL